MTTRGNRGRGRGKGQYPLVGGSVVGASAPDPGDLSPRRPRAVMTQGPSMELGPRSEAGMCDQTPDPASIAALDPTAVGEGSRPVTDLSIRDRHKRVTAA